MSEDLNYVCSQKCITESILCWGKGLTWSVVDIPSQILLTKPFFPFPANSILVRGGVLCPLLCGILSGLNLCMLCHSLCEFICISTMFYLNNVISLESHITYGS